MLIRTASPVNKLSTIVDDRVEMDDNVLIQCNHELRHEEVGKVNKFPILEDATVHFVDILFDHATSAYNGKPDTFIRSRTESSH
jgi:hypothetical protein